MNVRVQIMDAIRRGKGNASKKDIQEMTALAWGTMCKGVDQLIENEYVFARREKSQGRGRPTIPLCINGDAAYYVGIDIGAGHTRTVVCNLSFQTVYMDEVNTLSYTDPDSFFAFVGERVETALGGSRIEREKLRGIGVSVSGNVDFENGVIVSGANFGIRFGEHIRIGDYLRSRFDTRVYAVTTQAAASAAEYNFGSMAGTPNILTVGIGIGIGSGVVLENQIMISRPGRVVGHIGHLLVSGNRNVCTCGVRGCLESYSGGKSLAAVAAERFPKRTELCSAKALDEYAAAGDADARSVLDTAAAYNASGIANMIQLYAPEVIVFGGGQCRADGYLFTKTIEELRSILPKERLEGIQMEISTLGKYQSALGAARLVFEYDFGENKR